MTPAPAKLNLGLHVVRRRADGYHDLRTVFVRIPWADSVAVEPAEELVLTCTDGRLPVDERNLVVRAAQALRKVTGTTHGARIHLEKQIPTGAGLGGGSSDAATTLRLLNELWELSLADDELAVIGADLGSDVPFFFGPPAAVGEGRGEILRPLLDADGDPYVVPYHLCVVVPQVAVSTKEAYALVTPREDRGLDSGPQLLEEVVLSNDLDRWRRELVNDFEPAVFARYPEIASVKQMLIDAGAGFAAMSGSGSAVFGVFEQDAEVTAAVEAARAQGMLAWGGEVARSHGSTVAR